MCDTEYVFYVRYGTGVYVCVILNVCFMYVMVLGCMCVILNVCSMYVMVLGCMCVILNMCSMYGTLFTSIFTLLLAHAHSKGMWPVKLHVHVFPQIGDLA